MYLFKVCDDGPNTNLLSTFFSRIFESSWLSKTLVLKDQPEINENNLLSLSILLKNILHSI